MRSFIQMGLVLTALLIMSACQVQEETSKSNDDFSANASFAEKAVENKSKVKVKISDDGPHGDHSEIDQVVVSIKEVLLKTNNGELSIAQNIGAIDLMTLSSGRQIGIANTELEVGTKVNQIRLVLEEAGNYVQYKDGSFCDMKTPSQQKSGLKIINPEFTIAEGEVYTLTVDFSAIKSVVFRGNGSCLLKPVIKWGGLSLTSSEEEVEDPVVEDPVVEDPVVEDPVVEDPVVEDPVVEDPVVEDPVVEDPVVEDPVVEDPVVEDPVVEDPVVEDPVVEDPVVEDPVVEDPVVEDPVVEDPVVEDPVVEDPVVEDPVVEDPVVEDPVVEDPVVEDPVVEDPVVEDPVVEDPVVEDPVVEDPVNEEPNMEMCFNVDFDLYNMDTWPADFVYEDYAHCY